MGTFNTQLHIVEGQPQAKQLAEEFFSSNSSKPFVVFRYNNNTLADEVFFEAAEAKYGMGCVLEIKESRKGMYNLWSQISAIASMPHPVVMIYLHYNEMVAAEFSVTLNRVIEVAKMAKKHIIVSLMDCLTFSKDTFRHKVTLHFDALALFNVWHEQAHFAVISGHTQRGCQFYGDFANDLERYKEACQEVGQDCDWDNLDQIFYECTPSLQ